MATYLETIGKLQQQALDSLKQVQAAQLAPLTPVGELVTNVPAFQPASGIPSLPTFAELAELNTAFVRNVIEQQNAFASQLAGIFTTSQKNVVEAADRIVKTATPVTK